MLRTLAATRARTSPRDRLLELIRDHSWLKGSDFVLASGKHSAFFFDMKLTMFHPEGASLIADLVFNLVRHDHSIDYIGGLEMGAVPIVSTVVMRSYPERPIRGFFVRKEVKDHGTKKLIDGYLGKGSKTILLDDVTTTGGSVLKAVHAVRAAGCRVDKVITVVDRLEGAAENLKKEGVELIPIFTTKDFSR
jgi:orotate phosphoribosyltransferase